jgi:hypothetical protein
MEKRDTMETLEILGFLETMEQSKKMEEAKSEGEEMEKKRMDLVDELAFIQRLKRDVPKMYCLFLGFGIALTPGVLIGGIVSSLVKYQE